MAVLTPRSRVCKILRDIGSGSILRGWRLELDECGQQNVGFQAFCQWAGQSAFQGDAVELFHQDGDGRTLTFAEFAPAQNEVLERFRTWVKDTFGKPMNMMAAFDLSHDEQISESEFLKACKLHGFDGSEADVRELFEGLDLDTEGFISTDELDYLELDAETRVKAYVDRKREAEDKHNRLLTELSLAANAQGLPKSHRLSERPWLESGYPHLAVLQRQRVADRRRKLEKRQAEARTAFVAILRSYNGNEARAWRRVLDPTGTFRLTEPGLRRVCRNLDYQGDVSVLWASLDTDSTGYCTIESLSVECAEALVSFRNWVRKLFGTCAGLWDCPQLSSEYLRNSAEHTSRPHWVSDKKILFADLRSALVELQYPRAHESAHIKLLLQSLDYYGGGFISIEDLEWLDSWSPSEWLSEAPDSKAWAEVRALLLSKYGDLLKAWCCLLDQNTSNRVSWHEFKQACGKLNYTGNIGGAWRALDTDLSRLITLKEIDEGSHDLLVSFKEWADRYYGSVQLAFAALDLDNSGTLTFTELRRACKELHWNGRVRKLFDCLGLSRRCVAVKDVAFLDRWIIDPPLESLPEMATPVPKRRPSVTANAWRDGDRPPTMSTSPALSRPLTEAHAPSGGACLVRGGAPPCSSLASFPRVPLMPSSCSTLFHDAGADVTAIRRTASFSKTLPVKPPGMPRASSGPLALRLDRTYLGGRGNELRNHLRSHRGAPRKRTPLERTIPSLSPYNALPC